MKAAFISYNAIPGFTAGWHNYENNSALVIPNSKGERFAAPIEGEEGNRAVSDEVTRLWTQLSDSLDEVDKVVVYVGADGSEVAIHLAGRLPAKKVVYVLCDCGLSGKRSKIAAVGHQRAEQILCECRGTSTMSHLVHEFLKKGLVA